MRTKFHSLKRFFAVVLSVAMVLSMGGITGLVSAAAGYDGDWSDRYEVEVRVGSSDGALLSDVDEISVNDDLYVTGKIVFPPTVAEGGILGGNNITENYAGKTFYVAKVSEAFDLNGNTIDVSDLTGEIHYGEIKIDNGVITFQFDASTQVGHIANEKYSNEVLTDIVFTYKAAFKEDIKKTAKPDMELTFGDDPEDTFTVKLKEGKPSKVKVEKAEVEADLDKEEISWKITITNQGQDNAGDVFTITDRFDVQIPPMLDTLEVTDGKGSVSGAALSEDGKSFTFKYTADENFKTKGITREITYKSKLNVSEKTKLGYKNVVVNNYVDLKNEKTGDEVKNVKASYTVEGSHDSWITKKGENVRLSADGNTAYSDWRITVKTRNFFNSMSALYLHDRLANPQEYVPGSMKITIDVDGTTVANNVKVEDKYFNKEIGTQTDDGFNPFYKVEGYSFLSSKDDDPAADESERGMAQRLSGFNLTPFARDHGVTTSSKSVTFTVVYTTKVSDYEKYLLNGGSKTMTNGAWITFTSDKYNGDGRENTERTAEVTGKTTYVSGSISKTAARSESDGSIIWYITVGHIYKDANNRNTYQPVDLSNITIEDLLPEDENGNKLVTYDPATANLKVSGVYDEKGNYAKGHKYKVSADVQTAVDDKVTFTLVNGEADNKITNVVKISFKTYIKDVNRYAVNDNNNNYTNNANLLYNGVKVASAQATVCQKSQVITKSAESINYDNNTVKWNIDINQNGMVMGTNDEPVYITDTLPAGANIDLGSLRYEIHKAEKVTNKNNFQEGELVQSYNITATQGTKGQDLFYNYDETTRKLTVYVPNFTETGYRGKISYITEIDAEAKGLNTKTETAADGTTINYFTITNKAVLHNNYHTKNNPSASASVTYKYSELKKTGKILDNKSVMYGIGVNTARATIKKGTAYRDSMTIGMKYSQPTVEVYKASVSTVETLKADGKTKTTKAVVKKTEETLVKGEDYLVQFGTYKDDNGQDCEYMDIVFLKDIKEALYFEYIVDIPDASVAELYTNTIYAGQAEFGEDGKTVFTRREIEKAVGHADIETNYRVILTKTAKEDKNAYLAGAEYGIFADENCTNLLQKLTTETNGKITFWDLEYNATYYVRELTAPEGYQVDTSIHTVTTAEKTTEHAVEDDKITEEPPEEPEEPEEVLGEEFENPEEPEVLGEEFVETGDSRPILLWIVLLLCGALLLVGALVVKRDELFKKDDK